MQALQAAGTWALNNPDKIITAANAVMSVNDAIQSTQKTLDAQNNQNVTDTRTGGESSMNQGHKVPPIYF